MKIPIWVTKLFQTIDACDADGFVKFLTKDATLKFANADPVVGKIEIQKTIREFFASIKGLSHKVFEVWQEQNTVICRGEVTYTRKDENKLTVMFANIFKMNGHSIREYVIYVDISKLFA